MTTVLITGANRGLGAAMAEAFAARKNSTVIACCRNPESADRLRICAERNNHLEIEELDVVDHGSIEDLKHRLGTRPIDVLICNAGIFGKSRPATTGFEDQVFGNSDFENDWIMPFRTNALAPMKLAETFAENVAVSVDKKIAIITSIVGSITLAKGHMFGYAASKAAANMTARNLSISLRDRGITVNPIHPGYAKTDMAGDKGLVEVSDAISGVVAQIDGMSLVKTGEFLAYDKQSLPW